MAGGYGLSRMMGGAVEGLNEVEKRRDRETARNRSETQWQQGQEDREYSLNRREVTDAREDEQYKEAKDKQERFKAGGDVLRNWMASGELEDVNNYLNKYTSEGVGHNITKNDDGSYSSIMSVNGKDSEPKIISEDDIGAYMQRVMSQDPYAEMMAKNKAEAGGKAKKSERAHDMAKLEKEYELKRGLERVKNEYKGKDGKTQAAKAKANLAVNKELNDIAVQDYGSLFGEEWKFDTTRDKAMRSAQADLAGAYFFSSDEEHPSTNTASRQALQDMRKFLTKATIKADSELDEGLIDKKGYDDRVADLIDFQVDREITKIAPAPGQSLGREEQSAPTSKNGTEIPIEDIRLLKKEPTDQNKKYFDEYYGEGAADNILRGGKLGEQSKVSPGVSGEEAAGVSLIRDANASEAKPAKAKEEKSKEPRKKRDFSGQQKRKETRKSQKAHRQIAVSEFKNEWKNMDDEEKKEWFAENAQALKAASPRSHRKANKEVTDIRRKARFSKKGKEEYQLMREERKK